MSEAVAVALIGLAGVVITAAATLLAARIQNNKNEQEGKGRRWKRR